MLKIISQIRLDVAVPNSGTMVLAKQGDINSRFIEAEVCFNGCAINIPAEAEIRLHVIRADGYGSSFEGTVSDGGRVILPIDRWITSVAGDSNCSVEVSYDDRVLSTMSFTVRTECSDEARDLGDPEILPTDPEYDAVVEMLDDYKNGRLGNSKLHIRYSANADGSNVSEVWSEEKRYVGLSSAKVAPADANGYVWSLFAAKDGVNGKDGKSIESIVQAASGSNPNYGNETEWQEYEIIYTDGTTSYFVVYNGKNGADGAKGDKGDKGDRGATGAEGKSIERIEFMVSDTDDEGRTQKHYDVYVADNPTAIGSFTVTDGKDGAKGDKGDPYTLTEADKSAIAAAVKSSLTTETWTFELEDGSTVTKKVVLG